jgi:hypothetical protein
MSNLSDCLVDQTGLNWLELLSGWAPPLPAEFTVWMVNRFGDVLAVFEDGSINLLDVGSGQLSRVAENRDDFIEKVDTDNNADNWFLMSLTDQCVKSGMILSAGECYGFKIPSLLGGAYALENIETTNIAVHYSFLADIFQQTRDLPNGTKVEIKVVS